MPRLSLVLACGALLTSAAAAQSATLTNGSLAVATGSTVAIGAGMGTFVVGADGTLGERGGGRLLASSLTVLPARSLTAPTAVDVGGLGFVITTAASPGNTTVVRRPTLQTGNGQSSIARTYDVTAAVNTGLNATVVFRYDDAELNGIPEATLVLFRSTDGGATWQEIGGTVDTGANTITATGLDRFSLWTAGAAGMLPVELVAFAARADGRAAVLSWSTASETDNAGFGIERDDAGQWREVAFVAGRGTTSEQTRYTHRVERLPSGTHAFRLRQVDLDGTATYSARVEAQIVLGAPVEVTVRGRQIRFAVEAAQPVRADVFNVLGQHVATLFDADAAPGQGYTLGLGADLGAGVYFVRVTGRAFAETARVVVR